MELLSFFIGFTLLFRSMNSISFSLDLKRWGLSSWIVLLILGLLGLAASLLMIGFPIVAGLSLVYVVTFALIIGGIHSIVLSLRLRTLRKWMKQIS